LPPKKVWLDTNYIKNSEGNVASLIKPGTVKIVTKEGEIQVSLTIDLNVNLNTEGLAVLSGGSGSGSGYHDSTSKQEKVKEDKIEWAIPDFGDAPKINFGKKEG
jgi:hypothetical protein